MPRKKTTTPEQRKEQLHKWYLKNRDLVLAKSGARYRAKHKEIREQAMQRYRRDPVGVMLDRSRQRAKSKGVLFRLKRKDIFIPHICPVLGIQLERAVGKLGPSVNSPSLDRIDPVLGYVPGNVQVISYKANIMKSDATKDDLILFAKWVLDTYDQQGS